MIQSITVPHPQELAEQIAALLPYRVNVYQVEIIVRCGVRLRAAHVVRAEVGHGSHRAEISGSGDDPASAVVALHNAAKRYEVAP